MLTKFVHINRKKTKKMNYSNQALEQYFIRSIGQDLNQTANQYMESPLLWPEANTIKIDLGDKKPTITVLINHNIKDPLNRLNEFVTTLYQIHNNITFADNKTREFVASRLIYIITRLYKIPFAGPNNQRSDVLLLSLDYNQAHDSRMTNILKLVQTIMSINNQNLTRPSKVAINQLKADPNGMEYIQLIYPIINEIFDQNYDDKTLSKTFNAFYNWHKLQNA